MQTQAVLDADFQKVIALVRRETEDNFDAAFGGKKINFGPYTEDEAWAVAGVYEDFDVSAPGLTKCSAPHKARYPVRPVERKCLGQATSWKGV